MLNLVCSRRASRAASLEGCAERELGCLAPPASDCRVGMGEVLGPVLSAYTGSPVGMEAGGGAGSFWSATPSVSKQLSANWSIGCGSKLMLSLVSRCGALSLEFLRFSVGQT